MKLRFLRTPANLPAFREGTAHEVADEPAKKFIKAGVAVEADGPDDVFAVKAKKATKDGEESDEDADYSDEEIEAAANKVEFTQRGEDSKANRPPPHEGAIPTGAPANAQRSQPQNASVPAGEADGPDAARLAASRPGPVKADMKPDAKGKTDDTKTTDAGKAGTPKPGDKK